MAFLPATGHEGELLVRELPFDPGPSGEHAVAHAPRCRAGASLAARARDARGWGAALAVAAARAGHNGRMADTFIPTPALQRWVIDLWLAAGSSPDEARLTADHLVGANLAGHDSHGVGMVPRYVKSWLAGELQLNRHVAVGSDSGTMLSLDAQRGMGQSLAYEAMNLAIDRARQHGVCVMGLKNAHHIGRIGHWAEQAVAAGMVSVHFVNAMSTPVVAPFRGSRRYVTNPFTVGIPVPGREPLLLDFASAPSPWARCAWPQLGQDGAGPDADGRAGRVHRRPGRAVPPPVSRAARWCPGAAQGLRAGDGGRGAGRGADRRRDHAPGNLKYQHAVWNNAGNGFDPARCTTTAVRRGGQRLRRLGAIGAAARCVSRS